MGNAKMKKAMKYVETKNFKIVKCERQEVYAKTMKARVLHED